MKTRTHECARARRPARRRATAVVAAAARRAARTRWTARWTGRWPRRAAAPRRTPRTRRSWARGEGRSRQQTCDQRQWRQCKVAAAAEATSLQELRSVLAGARTHLPSCGESQRSRHGGRSARAGSDGVHGRVAAQPLPARARSVRRRRSCGAPPSGPLRTFALSPRGGLGLRFSFSLPSALQAGLSFLPVFQSNACDTEQPGGLISAVCWPHQQCTGLCVEPHPND